MGSVKKAFKKVTGSFKKSLNPKGGGSINSLFTPNSTITGGLSGAKGRSSAAPGGSTSIEGRSSAAPTPAAPPQEIQDAVAAGATKEDIAASYPDFFAQRESFRRSRGGVGMPGLRKRHQLLGGTPENE